MKERKNPRETRRGYAFDVILLGFMRLVIPNGLTHGYMRALGDVICSFAMAIFLFCAGERGYAILSRLHR